ncbi:MAG TPA: LLM class flavin-dependent oxidoreductase [Pseudonocardia sp.]|jgi:alkanesulfonate monooxygenase
MHWFLPTYGDGRQLLNTGTGLRTATIGYLSQVATAAEQLGFTGVLTPTGLWCEDAWVTTATLIPRTERLKFLVAFRPAALSPMLAAQLAATYQRLSGGRLLLNVVTGGEPAEQRAYGDFLAKDERYARSGEFLGVLTALLAGHTVNHRGPYLELRDAALEHPPEVLPTIYFAGSSAAAGEVAARHVDVYLTWGEPPDQVAQKINWIRRLAAARGREVRFGIRLHVIARDTAGAAWARAAELLEGISPAAIAQVQAALAHSESEGQRRMSRLHRGGTDRLEVAPNLWAGVGLVRGGAGTALVGSHAEIAERIAEYHRLGISEFILSGHPHLEEAWWFGEGVLPLLRQRGLWWPPTGSAAAPEAERAASVPFAR